MKKIISFLFLSFLTLSLSAQSGTTLIKRLSLVMPGETGSNGASMVWNPTTKKYYCAFAGNSAFPLAVFNATGKQVSDDDLECMFDIRGLWYNPSSRQIEGNGFNDYGWNQFELDDEGIPVDSKNLIAGMHQPDKQSVGAFDNDRKQVFFLHEGRIVYYKNGKEDRSIDLELGDEGVKAANDADMHIYNYNSTACYTGIKGGEYALLNINQLRIELYNRKGKMTGTLALPDDAPVNDLFNFAFTNGAFWLFDKDERTWYSFK